MKHNIFDNVVMSTEERLREEHPGLKDAWEQLQQAQQKFHTTSDKYNIMLKLVTVDR